MSCVTKPSAGGVAGGAAGIVVLAALLLSGCDKLAPGGGSAARTIPFCVFQRTVAPGTPLREGDYVVVEVPAKQAPLFRVTWNCLTPAEAAGRAAAGEPLMVEGRPGQFVQNLHFTKGDAAPRSPAVGKVWIPLRLSPANQNSALRVGAVVNITAPFNTPGERLPRTMTVMEHVTIMALGQYTEEDVAGGGRMTRVSGYRSFSVEVEPREANLLLDIQRGAAGDFDLMIASEMEPAGAGGGINKEVLALLKLTPAAGARPRPVGGGN